MSIIRKTSIAAIRVVLIVVGYVFTSQAVFAKQEVHRLPTTTMPTAQSIELNLDPDKTGYSGRANIDITVSDSVKHIGIHWVDLNVSSITLVSKDDNRLLSASAHEYDIQWLSDGKPIRAGDYQLLIEFSNDFSTDALGLYRTKYQDRHYLFTQFESTYARRAFPIFDEPSFKIPYRLILTVPRQLEVATNTAVKKQVVQGEYKTIHFKYSPPMPSYLIALTVGPLDKTPIKGLSVPGFIYSPKGTGGETGFAIQHTPKILKALEEYFGIDYPYQKLDFVAVPDYAFGAMENPGLVTYRTDFLLRGDTATGYQALGSLNVIAHELAHMWYGDLVTMEWWDDLWLNEAFATWMAQKVMDAHYPDFQSKLYLPQDGAYQEDGLAATKPIRKEIKSSDDILDGIGLNYSKGHAILDMLEQTMGEENFQTAIRKYMRTHQWKNTVASDLWKALSEQSQFDIGQIADTFLNQAGYALINIDDTGKISQRRFRNFGNEIPEQSWNIPLTIKYKLSDNIKEVQLLLTDKEVQVRSLVEAEWILPVTNGTGYFRWKLPKTQYAALIKDLKALNEREKVALLSNSRGLLDAGEISVKEHLKLLSELTLETNVVVFTAALEEIKLIGERHTSLDNQKLFSAYIDEMLTPWFNKLGSSTRKGDSDNILQLRPRLLRTIGQLGNNSTLNKEMIAVAHRYLKGDKSIDNGLGREALRIAAMLDHSDLVETYFKTYKTSDDANLKINIMQSMYFTSEESINYVLRQMLDKDIPAGDKGDPFNGLFYANKDQAILYQWMEKNFEQLLKALPEIYHGFMPLIMSPECEVNNLKRLEAFYKGKDKIYKASLNKSIESENNCLRLKKREAASFLEFLSSYRS